MTKVNYIIYEEDRAFIAQYLSPDVASEGDTETHAIANLKEALELYFEFPSAIAKPIGPLRFGELTLDI